MLKRSIPYRSDTGTEVYYQTSRTKKADKYKKWYVVWSDWSEVIDIASIPILDYTCMSYRERIKYRVRVKRSSLYRVGIKHILEEHNLV